MAVDMKNGAFVHDNMAVPEGDRVLPLFSLKGRTAIVSGAGAGIGLGVAEALAEAGANVAIWYNSNKQALVEAETIEKTYGVKCKPAQPTTTAFCSTSAFLNPGTRDPPCKWTLRLIECVFVLHLQAGPTRSTSSRPRP
jgi:sorbose reductase